MTPEHLLDGHQGPRAVRPDGIYLAGGEQETRRQVWVEVDLGHYSRKRICEKVDAGIDSYTARAIVIVCHTARRAEQIYNWLDLDCYHRTQLEIRVLALDELSLDGLDPWLHPATAANPDLPVATGSDAAWEGSA